jgi:hypothetical protein
VARAPIVEIKRHLNKPTQRFACAVLARRPGEVWLQYAIEQDGEFAGVPIPAGSRTLAEYVTGRPYVAWRFAGPDGRTLGCLVHIIEGLAIHADRVEYTDLILDVWAEPGAAPRLLDADELDEAVQAGEAAKDQADRARRAAAEVMESWDEIWARLSEIEPSPPTVR